MRQTCLNSVYELAKSDKRIVFIGSDLGVGVLDAFKKEIPDRFFMEGISEQLVVGMAAGMALEGKIPYVNTIATFLTRRCYEQVALDLCLHNLKVRLISNGGGLVYAPLGPTHLAIEDIAIMRVLPNMTVMAAADAVEMRKLMPLTVDVPGPIYIRIAKGGDPVITDENYSPVWGKIVKKRTGKDIILAATGITTKLCLDAAQKLSSLGIESTVLHIPFIKPLDVEGLVKSVAECQRIVSVEEHVLDGGLGSAILEALADRNLLSGVRVQRIGIPSTFPKNYGSQNELMKSFGIDSGNIVAVVESMMKSV